MKPYKIDVAVKTTIWTRPGIQRRQFEVIKKARPSILILVSDGGRNECEWELIKQNRRMFDEEIDWDCTIYKLYEDVNIGVWPMINRGHEFVWSKVDECIFLEDDDIPSISFFSFCKEMLDKYRNDERIGFICGFNPLGLYADCPYDYFFTGAGTIWGIATWKRTYVSFDIFSRLGRGDKYLLSRIKELADKDFYKDIIGYLYDPNYNGHEATDEFFYEISKITQHQIRIYPKINMISNVGYQEGGGAHTESDLKLLPKGIRRFYNTKTYEMDFPLNHPKCMIEDKLFEKKINRMYGVDMPWVGWYRKAERLFLLNRYGRFLDWMKVKLERK